MTQDKFDKLVAADILRLQGCSEETIIQYLNTKNSLVEAKQEYLNKTNIYWTGSPEINPFKDDDWNNDNDNSDIPESEYERDYEFNRANNN